MAERRMGFVLAVCLVLSVLARLAWDRRACADCAFAASGWIWCGNE